MNVWIVIGVITASLSAVGVVTALISRDVKYPFIVGFNTMLPVAAAYCYFGDGSLAHKTLIMTMVGLYTIRMNIVLTQWYDATAAAKLKDVLPAGQIYGLPVILVNIFGWLYCLPFYWAADMTGPFGVFEYSVLGIYTLGTLLHFGSDYQKLQFKKQRDSKGKILDTGFWSLCRHPNYFGDFLIYVSFGVLAGNWWGVVSPLVNIGQYLGDAIPKSEEMSAKRYGDDWDSYKQRVKCLIPFVY